MGKKRGYLVVLILLAGWFSLGASPFARDITIFQVSKEQVLSTLTNLMTGSGFKVIKKADEPKTWQELGPLAIQGAAVFLQGPKAYAFKVTGIPNGVKVEGESYVLQGRGVLATDDGEVVKILGKLNTEAIQSKPLK